MVWGAFCATGKVALTFTSTRMNSEHYIQLLADNLLPFIRRNRRSSLIFQQDNAAIHASRQTKDWLNDERIPILDWPARSPDCNPIENIWGIMVRRIYANNKQYDRVEELEESILACWNNLEQSVIDNLISSMENRIYSIISNKGNKIQY